MFNKIIDNYIKNLNKNDILLFGQNNNIELSNSELNYIYNEIKNNYKILLSNNYMEVFNKAKDYIDNEKLKKIYNLFINYRLKYNNFLNE
ncbi:MAG: DUF2624 family protein [Bacilli bacterium]|nr:DUF2624 family protein [Bacilli bacterium]